MAKNSKERIEKDIKSVLYELQKNSRSSNNDIANKLGFSHQKTCQIIKDLENDNTIWGYTAIVDDNKINRKRFFILTKRTHLPVTEEKIKLVIKRDLKKEATKLGIELECSYYVNGSYDWILCISAGDIKQVKRFCDYFNKAYKPYISEYLLLEVLFPVERIGFDNPNVGGLKEFF